MSKITHPKEGVGVVTPLYIYGEHYIGGVGGVQGGVVRPGTDWYGFGPTRAESFSRFAPYAFG